MRKLFLFLSVFLVLACESDDNNSANLESSIVVDGISFRPDSGSYWYGDVVDGDLHKNVYFRMQKGGSNPMSMIFTLYLPMAKTDLGGVYSFGPGTADELLVSGEFTASPEFYAIVGTTLTLTELGDSKFRITFQNPVALDPTENFAEKQMSGQVEGKFLLQEN